MRKLLFGVGALSLLLLAGCAVTRPAQPPQAMPKVTLAALRQSVEASGQRFKSLKGLARVSVVKDEQKFSGSQALLAEKPDRIRSEALALFGQPWLVLAADGQRLQVFIPGEHRFYSGAPTPENLQRFTRLPLRLEDLVHLLLYQVPLLVGKAELGQSSQGPQLELVNPQGFRQQLGFDSRLRLVSSRYLDPAGKTWLAVDYADFSGDREDFPQALHLEMPAEKLTVDVRFRKVDLNADIPQEKFALKPPAGMVITPLTFNEDQP